MPHSTLTYLLLVGAQFCLRTQFIIPKAIVQIPYKGPGTDNWFSTPLYPANTDDAVQVALNQASNNQKSYPAKGWPTYVQGVTPAKESLPGLHKPVTDSVAGDWPDWQPIAGGQGFGKPRGQGNILVGTNNSRAATGARNGKASGCNQVAL